MKKLIYAIEQAQISNAKPITMSPISPVKESDFPSIIGKGGKKPSSRQTATTKYAEKPESGFFGMADDVSTQSSR